jgi:hypothetical protein
MAVYEALLLNTVVPQIQAAQAGDSYVMVVNATTPALRITQTGTGNAISVEDEANPDATPFVVSAAGDVGIGTSSPGSKLDVLGGVSSTSDWGNVNITSRNVINSANRIYAGLKFQDSGSGDAGAIGYSYNGTGYNMFFGTVASVGGAVTTRLAITSTGEFQWKPNGSTQAMTLDASGRLLVGLTADTAAGGYFGIIQAQGSYPAIVLKGTETSAKTWQIAENAGSLAFYNTTDGERARITSGGDVCFGGTTSSTNLYSGTAAADGSAVSSSNVLLIQKGTDANIYCSKPSGYSNGNLLYFYVNNTAVGSVSTDGTTTAYNTTSDYRLKDNITPMSGALAKIAALKPVTYKWKSNGSDGEGFIAHELAEVVPQCVTGQKDSVDAEGKPVYQGIDTSFLVATLTAAIQEQQAIISDLTARLSALEAK